MLEENIGINICDHGLGDGFLDMTVKVRAKRKYKKLTTRNDCTHSKIGLW